MLINKQKVESEKKFVGELSEALTNRLKNNRVVIYKTFDVNEKIREKLISDLKEGKIKIPA
jgi:hypothetical protein